MLLLIDGDFRGVFLSVNIKAGTGKWSSVCVDNYMFAINSVNKRYTFRQIAK